MVTCQKEGAFIRDGITPLSPADAAAHTPEDCRKNTIAHSILSAHNQSGDEGHLKIKFDAMASHDITYVGIVQTARASGLTEFPLEYVLTNCHNSLCAVGGTINEDDHLFGLSAAKKYGGVYVPAHQAVIHQYMREMEAGCGKMILGSDSHTRYGALGTMAVGEGGPELVKQLLCRTWDIEAPEVVAVLLTGAPVPGVGPQDVALALIGATFQSGFVKNRVLEFVGEGIQNLSADYRNGIDVMTTETTCLSSIWMTDETIEDYYKIHGRPQAYKKLVPGGVAYYDRLITIDLSKIRPMIALPFHPSNVYPIHEFHQNAAEILHTVEQGAVEALGERAKGFTLRDKMKNGRLMVEQGVIAGCAGGTFQNITDAADILAGYSIGNDEFTLSVYPSSQPVFLELCENGTIATLMKTGATIRSAFCGPCFGAGDVPANGTLSIRHSTRNFPSREGAKPGEGQLSSVALMDARSIAATAKNGGALTGADEWEGTYSRPDYHFNAEVYKNRCYFGFKKPEPELPLRMGPNIADWPEQVALPTHLLLQVASLITDPVTTTDELIPSGETSSYRSNPERLAQFTLSRKDPTYVPRAKETRALEALRRSGADPFADPRLSHLLPTLTQLLGEDFSRESVGIGSVIYAHRPGDGSAREQAASCQRVLGGCANIAMEYATKRYRSNLINWGMLPLLLAQLPPIGPEDWILVPNVRALVETAAPELSAFAITDSRVYPLTFTLGTLTDDERQIILDGCLINYYRGEHS